MSNSFYTNVAIQKNDILLCGYENGQRIRERVPYQPYLFVPTPKETKYRTLDGKGVGKVEFDTIYEARDFLRQYKDSHGMSVYGSNNFAYTFVFDNYRGEIDYDPSLISVCTVDIEVDIANDKGFPDIQAADNEVTLITMSRNGKKVVFGCKPYTAKSDDVTYYLCKNEKALLTAFIEMWNSIEYMPDVVTGWNVEFFDIPYLINRIMRVLGPKYAKKLSPWGILNENNIVVMGKEQQVYVPVGVTILDYMQLYKKFAYTVQERYTLDHVAFMELGERKLDYGEYGSLAGLQVKNWEKYVDYNIRDVVLVDKLDDKLKLIELIYAIAYDGKINFQDAFTTVRAWDIIIHNYLLERNIVVHQNEIPETNRGILGGYVKDPQVGMHDWVVSLDLNSLYPHIIMQYNISPDTFVGWLSGYEECWDKEEAERRALFVLNGGLEPFHDQMESDNYTVAANLTTFTRNKYGFLPQLMQKYYNERVGYKSKMIEAKKALQTAEGDEKQRLIKVIAKYNNMQMAKKIQLNSAYGALGNAYFRWYRKEFAEAITSSGQLSTRWIERKLNGYLNGLFGTEDDWVIACDTDSVYLRLDKLVKHTFGDNPNTIKVVNFLDKLCKQKLEPFIDKCYEELCTYVNGYDQKMVMKRECIANKAIWTGKKHYILNVFDLEGVRFTEPQLKMQGIEAIRSSTPQVCRDGIKDALKVIMNESESALQKFIEDYRENFVLLPFEDVAFPRSVSDMDKYIDAAGIYRKGTPINVKGSLIYNHAVRERKLDKKYEMIASGQKIKYAYCIQPNPLRTSVIAVPAGSALPPELNMDSYVDNLKQFDKAFLEPIKTITGAIGWEVERRATLDAFFV